MDTASNRDADQTAKPRPPCQLKLRHGNEPFADDPDQRKLTLAPSEERIQIGRGAKSRARDPATETRVNPEPLQLARNVGRYELRVDTTALVFINDRPAMDADQRDGSDHVAFGHREGPRLVVGHPNDNPARAQELDFVPGLSTAYDHSNPGGDIDLAQPGNFDGKANVLAIGERRQGHAFARLPPDMPPDAPVVVMAAGTAPTVPPTFGVRRFGDPDAFQLSSRARGGLPIGFPPIAPRRPRSSANNQAALKHTEMGPLAASPGHSPPSQHSFIAYRTNIRALSVSSTPDQAWIGKRKTQKRRSSWQALNPRTRPQTPAKSGKPCAERSKN